MISILVRTVVFYITLTLFMRFMGKRQIGEMQLSEFVCAVLISEMAAFPIADPDIPLLHGLIPMMIIVSLEIIIAFICVKNNIFRRIIATNCRYSAAVFTQD